jgi:hypothetical protein
VILAIVLAFSLVAATFAFHYRVLLWLGSNTQKFNLERQSQVLVIVIALFLAHIVEIGFYALVYNWSVSLLDLGVFEGAPVGNAMNYLYYSGVIYTTLGLGDIQPLGHIRFITAVEALNGFLLITWSASFTFLAMGRLWPWEIGCGNSNKEK